DSFSLFPGGLIRCPFPTAGICDLALLIFCISMMHRAEKSPLVPTGLAPTAHSYISTIKLSSCGVISSAILFYLQCSDTFFQIETLEQQNTVVHNAVRF